MKTFLRQMNALVKLSFVELWRRNDVFALVVLALARRVLQEAKERNPESLEIAIAEARLEHDGGRGDVNAARRLFGEARAKAMKRCGGRPEELSEEDARAFREIELYLSKLPQP